MPSFRKIFFQIHLWTGLIAGIFFILLGLSGSALVYPSLLQSAAPVPKTTAQGAPLPLEQIIAAARQTTPDGENRDMTVTLPQAAGDAVTVQFNAQRGGRGEGRAAGRRGNAAAGAAPPQEAERRGPPARRGGNLQVFVDPSSGQVLGSRTTVPSPLVGLAHQMHEAMLLGGAGRTLVAWLGVGMLFLGLSGLYLWWPRKGQWKFAFGLRRTARGFRLYREIHGMLGIWFWVIFLFVTATSIPLGFPSVLALLTGNAPRGEGPPPAFGQTQTVDAPDGVTPLRLADLITNAEKTSGAKAVAVTVPAQANRAIGVTLESADSEGRNIALDPYKGSVLPATGQLRDGGLNRRTIEQLHGGQRVGPVWRFLVFLSGFLPLIFVVTGFMMWLKKRQNKSSQTRVASLPVRERAGAVAQAARR
jgi:uncharacterized iron-regulated membrane protein